MTPAVQTRATLDDLMRVEGKAELIGGRIVPLHAHGSYAQPGRGLRIYASLLDDYAEEDASRQRLAPTASDSR